jgi:uncharacterized protein YcbK (DUF882 family)
MSYLDGQPKLFTSLSDIPFGWQQAWPNFHPEEFVSKGNGQLLVVPTFMDKLQKLRTETGRAMKINSGYRDPLYNNLIASTGMDGPHTTGRAVDIGAKGEEAYAFATVGAALGFTGCGVKQKGSHSGRFIHLDDLLNSETKGPRPWMWSY